MILQLSILGNLVRILNSVVLVGLYYGFLTTLSTGPSYLLLVEGEVMEERAEKRVASITGFMMGQLIMFISTYYVPLHLALNRPHALTVLLVPYLWFHVFWSNHKHEFDYGSTNSLRNFTIQCVFVNNLIFPLFNHFHLPNSIVTKLVNIYMFRCNNKILFVTSSFVGWLIGHILFMKGLGLVVGWLRQNQSILSNKAIRSKKYRRSKQYLLAEWRYSTSRIFTVIFFITGFYYLSGPLFRKKQYKSPHFDLHKGVCFEKSEEEGDVEIETAYEMKGTKQEDATEEIRVNRKGIVDSFIKGQPLGHLLFDTEGWNEPARYIRRMIRDDMSQYFFDIFKSEGKERISFTSPSSLSHFVDRIKRRISPDSYEKSSPLDLWAYTNKINSRSLNNELNYRMENIDKKLLQLSRIDMDTNTRLCNDNCTKEYIAENHDPFVNNLSRKRICKSFSPPMVTGKKTKKFLDNLGINRIESLVLSDPDSQEVTPKINIYSRVDVDTKELSTALEIVDFFTFFNHLLKEAPASVEKKGLNQNQKACLAREMFRLGIVLGSKKEGRKYVKSLLTQIVTARDDQKGRLTRNKIKELNKQLLQYTYKLIAPIQGGPRGADPDDMSRRPLTFEIVARDFHDIVVLNATPKNANAIDFAPQPTSEVTLIRFSKRSDFNRELIKGTARSERRKVFIFSLYHPHAHSPLFIDRVRNIFLALFYRLIRLILRILRILRILSILSIFRNLVGWRGRSQTVEYFVEEPKPKPIKIKKLTKKEQNRLDEEFRAQVAEAWDGIAHAQQARSIILLTLSILRRYILLPLCIIGKNVGRILLFQPPEWSEDFQELAKEVHLKCTYYGAPAVGSEFPENWFTDGLQIKILFPFCLKPWNKLKLRSSQAEEQAAFSYLTAWGDETVVPFGRARQRPSFFKPVLQEFKKKIRKFKKKYFGVGSVFKGNLGKYAKEAKKWVIKSVALITKKRREVEIDESRELKEEQVVSPSWTNSSFTERKMNDLADRTSTIRNQIEKISKEKKKVTTRINNLFSTNRFEQWQILKRRNARIICKLPLFLKFFIERIYTDIFLSSITKMNTKLFLKFKKKMIEKSIYNNSRKEKRIKKKKKNPMAFISKSLANISKSKTNSPSFYDLSDISQAYVFYKLSKIQVNNSYKLRSLLDYQGIPFFPKPEIKDSFEKRGVVDSKLGDNQFPSYEMNQWKNWLRGHYQYNLDKKWSRLIQEWRNPPYKHHRKVVSKRHFFESSKDPLIEIDSNKLYSLSNQKDTFQKEYRYDLLSYKFLDYENKTEYLFSGSPFQRNKKQGVSYTTKKAPLDRPRNIFSNHSEKNNLGWFNTLYRYRYRRRARGRVDFGNHVINSNEEPSDLNFLIPENNPPGSPQAFFDWMEMNEKQNIANRKSWFFPELLLVDEAYKRKPWWIPTKSLLFTLHKNANQNDSENQKINEQESFLIASNEEYEKQKQKQKERISQDQDIEEEGDYESLARKLKKEQQNGPRTVGLDTFMTHYLFYQLGCNENLIDKMLSNLRICSLLLRLDPKKIVFATLTTKEIHLELMERLLIVSDLVDRGEVLLDPERLSLKQEGRVIMVRTVGAWLRHQRDQQVNQKYQEPTYVSKNQFGEAISTQQRRTQNRKENPLDFLVPENILSFRRRQKLRILSCLGSKNRKNRARNPVEKNLNNSISHDIKRDKERHQLMKIKLFLWPNYRFEDLACMNRYWFDTTNGSRFSMLRNHLYPRLKMDG